MDSHNQNSQKCSFKSCNCRTNSQENIFHQLEGFKPRNSLHPELAYLSCCIGWIALTVNFVEKGPKRVNVGAVSHRGLEMQWWMYGFYRVAAVLHYQPVTWCSRRSAKLKRSTRRAASAKPSWWRMRSTAGCGWAGACVKTMVTWVAELTSWRQSTGTVRVGEPARSRSRTRRLPWSSRARKISSRTWKQPTAV